MSSKWFAAFILLFSAPIAITSPALADTQSPLALCHKMNDQAKRLACYDEVTNQQAATTQQAVPKTDVKTDVETQTFGIKHKPSDDEVTKIYLQVKSISKDPYGALRMTFHNGQVWKQHDGRRFKIKENDKVFIRKGALGSFILGTDERNKTIRVKRLK